MGHMEYEKLCRLVEQWNTNRIDLFHLTQPTQDLEVEGVMRFYFCDDEGRVCTKCIRVSSTATTQAVIDALVDKFLPDLKMLTDPDYTLWEVHEGGEERRLDGDEKPLLVQLNWHKDDKEGRFLLKKHGMNFVPIQAMQDHDQSSNIKRNNKRFSKREKKEEKVKKRHKDIITVHEGVRQENMDAMRLYKQVPPTTFTRTISNPEIVMKKRREKRIESKLRDMGNGGSLKIYGEEIVPSRPYVTILVSAKDRASEILKEALSKYNIKEVEWGNFQLIQVELARDSENMGRSLTDLSFVGTSNRREIVVSEDECPLVQLANASPDVQLFFTIRRRVISPLLHRVVPQSMPVGKCCDAYLISLHDNSRIPVSEGVTEVGNGDLHLFARHHIRLPSLCSRHCVITLTGGVFTITPSTPEAVIAINERRIDRTETVLDGNVIRLGKDHVFRLSYPRSPHSTALNNNLSMAELKKDNDNSAQGKGSSGTQAYEVAHVIPLSLLIDERSIRNLLIEGMSRSAESSSFPLTSSFLIFIGLHSLSDRSIIGREVINSLCTHLSHVSNSPSHSRGRLLYWLSNASHLHHFLSSDICFSLPLDRLSSLVQSLFHSLVIECTRELNVVVPSFFHPSPSDQRGPLVSLLDSILDSCRSSQLNADITIQLASQLFSSLNAVIFNQMVEMRCTSSLGHVVSNGLSELDRWASCAGIEFGLVELLFDSCTQAANLLIAPKNDMASMGSTTYKLNSLQIRHLLSSFEVSVDESAVGNDVLHRMIGLAERQADELSAEEGIPLTLLETNRLSGMDMILPQDGYFTNRSFSHFEPLMAFLNELAIKGVCSKVEWNEGSVGWTTDRLERVMPSTLPYSRPSLPTESSAHLVKVHLNRGAGGIGLSIVAAQGMGETECGIYIKKVLDGSVAAKDGRLSAGDELIQVNDHSLRGLSQEEAARTLSSCGPVVRFVVRMGAATTNGLLSYLVSPPTSQSNLTERVSPSPSHLYTPFISRHTENESNVTQSSASAFSIPNKNARSISTIDLYQVHDPNTSFSGRSMASSTVSAFSALPSHYKRPTVIQPARNCASPSTLRSGAVSPSLLSHSSYRMPSPHSNRKGAVSPTPLSHSAGSMQHVDLIHSPPLARSSPIPQSHSMHSFSRSMDSSNGQRVQHLPPLPPSFEHPSIQSMRSVAQSAASAALNKRKEGPQRSVHPQSTVIDDIEGGLLRMSLGAEARYGEIMGDSISAIHRPLSTPLRRETLIDDVADLEMDSPSIVGAQEVYRDPRSKRISVDSSHANHSPFDGSKLGFGDKMRFFARGLGEGSPPTRITTSSAQRIIQDDH